MRRRVHALRQTSRHRHHLRHPLPHQESRPIAAFASLFTQPVSFRRATWPSLFAETYEEPSSSLGSRTSRLIQFPRSDDIILCQGRDVEAGTTDPQSARSGMALWFLHFDFPSPWLHRRCQETQVGPDRQQRCSGRVLYSPRPDTQNHVYVCVRCACACRRMHARVLLMIERNTQPPLCTEVCARKYTMQVTGAAAELVLDSNWTTNALPRPMPPCRSARSAK